MSTWGSLYFQNSCSYIIEYLIFFHDYTIIVILIIIIIVGYLLFNSCCGKLYNRGLFEGQELETVWTILPRIFLLFIAFPSLGLLYLMEEMEFPEITIKVIGHQWFWCYEYRDLIHKGYDSYIIKEEDSLFRLLEVDNILLVPFNINVRIIVSRVDVIHSWALPSLGVKVDAIPGRLNQISIVFNRIGVFIGQCSEICGVNHRFIPIFIFVIPRLEFLNKWLG